MKKIAIITGGSRGLGKNMAIALAKKNINVILTYNSKKEEAVNVVQEIEKLGAKAAAIQLNVAEVKTFDNFVESIKAILKNNFQTDNFDILVFGDPQMIGTLIAFLAAAFYAMGGAELPFVLRGN